MALRYFCGGDPKDIGPNHGVHSAEVLKSVWYVVDAIHQTSSMNIKFPVSHVEQKNIAHGFKAKSRIGLENCVGAIDGILIWIKKPSRVDVLNNIKFGEAKFFCGGKKKYGLNLMATCDARGYFLDIEIMFPGSTSDFYAVLNSKLQEKLEQPGFLADGLALYGDNAYVNSPYMVVPFKGTQDGPKDAFNFFQSSLRIHIECAFGMLVHRWGILRKAIPQNITVAKTTSLVLALCKLHNFCINESDSSETMLSADEVNIVQCGGFNQTTSNSRPEELLDGGEHFDDIPSNNRQDRYVAAQD